MVDLVIGLQLSGWSTLSQNQKVAWSDKGITVKQLALCYYVQCSALCLIADYMVVGENFRDSISFIVMICPHFGGFDLIWPIFLAPIWHKMLHTSSSFSVIFLIGKYEGI